MSIAHPGLSTEKSYCLIFSLSLTTLPLREKENIWVTQLTEMSFPQMRAVCAVSVMEQAGNACPGQPPQLSPRQQLSAGELGGFILE